MRAHKKILGMVMAGGMGERLFPLTRDRAKPAVPFGGKYRIIDIVLSNFINSGIHSIYVLTQYKSQSLTEHIIHLQNAWGLFSPYKDNFLMPVPAQKRTGESWYEGTADSISQNTHLIEAHDPDIVAVFGGDHIYRMDVRQMVADHEHHKAEVTVAVIPVPIEQAHMFGVLQVDNEWRVVGFQEKPTVPAPMPGKPDRALVSMGNYLFSSETLLALLAEDSLRPTASDKESILRTVSELKRVLGHKGANMTHRDFAEMLKGAVADATGHALNSVTKVLEDPDVRCTHHDFGRDILPSMVNGGKLFAYDFSRNRMPGVESDEENTYWRDIGTIDAYYEASMDLRDVHPAFNLYNPYWPIRTAEHHAPPAKFVHESGERVGRAINSIVCDGSILSGCTVRQSIVGRNVRIADFAEVVDSILMDGVRVGEGAKIRKAIIDKNITIAAGEKIGFDPARDRERFPDCAVSEKGIVVIPRDPHLRKPVTAIDVDD